MRKLLFAWTPPGSNYPPYLNISTDNGKIVITVRSPASETGECGSTSSVSLPVDMLLQLRLALYDDSRPTDG